MLYSALGLLCDRDNIRMDLKNTTITLLMSPLFFSRYIPIYIKCLSKKNKVGKNWPLNKARKWKRKSFKLIYLKILNKN